MITSDALVINILLNHLPESRISRDFLPIVMETEHIELKLKHYLHQKTLYFVHLPLQRHVQKEGLRLHLYFYAGVVSLDEVVVLTSLLLYHLIIINDRVESKKADIHKSLYLQFINYSNNI